MALTTCKECGAKVSTKAAACPSCGAKVKPRTSPLTLLTATALTVAVIVGLANEGGAFKGSGAAPAVDTTSKVHVPTRADIEVNQVLAGARLLRSTMKKPESFELLSAGMIDGKTICYEYRARNSFNDQGVGHYVITDAVQSGTQAAWNQHCAGKRATDYSHVRAVLK